MMDRAILGRAMNYARILFWTMAVAVFVALPVRGQAGEEIPLGSPMPMPDASMTDVRGGQATLDQLSGERGTAVVFWSNQCPWVDRYSDRLVDLSSEYSDAGISFVLVNSNDTEAFPRESAEASREHLQDAGFPSSVAYLSDPSSALAKAFGAERTPHVFVFDENDVLVYVGTIDDSPGDPANVGARYLRSALDATSAGNDVDVTQTKAFGCTIKFKT